MSDQVNTEWILVDVFNAQALLSSTKILKTTKVISESTSDTKNSGNTTLLDKIVLNASYGHNEFNQLITFWRKCFSKPWAAKLNPFTVFKGINISCTFGIKKFLQLLAKTEINIHHIQWTGDSSDSLEGLTELINKNQRIQSLNYVFKRDHEISMESLSNISSSNLKSLKLSWDSWFGKVSFDYFDILSNLKDDVNVIFESSKINQYWEFEFSGEVLILWKKNEDEQSLFKWSSFSFWIEYKDELSNILNVLSSETRWEGSKIYLKNLNEISTIKFTNLAKVLGSVEIWKFSKFISLDSLESRVKVQMIVSLECLSSIKFQKGMNYLEMNHGTFADFIPKLTHPHLNKCKIKSDDDFEYIENWMRILPKHAEYSLKFEYKQKLDKQYNKILSAISKIKINKIEINLLDCSNKNQMTILEALMALKNIQTNLKDLTFTITEGFDFDYLIGNWQSYCKLKQLEVIKFKIQNLTQTKSLSEFRRSFQKHFKAVEIIFIDTAV